MGINIICLNMERYLAFTLGNELVFIDSFQFMNQSSDKLLRSLPEESFKHTKNIFPNEKQFNEAKWCLPICINE